MHRPLQGIVNHIPFLIDGVTPPEWVNSISMYPSLLIVHSIFRWLVLVSLVYALIRAYKGYITGSIFAKADNSIRHWTATIAQVQLTIGFTLYFKSPVIRQFFATFSDSIRHAGTAFFGVIHILLMFTAVGIITTGSALAKRKPTDREKFRTMVTWFSIALLIIFLAIPWPFSPLANRPYLRTF